MFAASVAIQNDKGEILLVREADPRVHGKWNLPGGHAETGESLHDAAYREVFEETGLEVRPNGLLGVYQHADGGLNFVFRAQARKGAEPVSGLGDILAAEWLSIAEALALPPDQVLRRERMSRILEDLQKDRRFPCEVIRSVPREFWE